MTTEIWKNIDGYTDYYVSNLGRIKSTKRGERILKPYILNNHKHVSLSENNICKEHKVAIIVLKTFKPNFKPYKYNVFYLDGDIYNTSLDNLYVPKNCKRAKRLTAKQVKNIYMDCKIMGITKVSKKYGITQNKVSAIKTKHTFKKVTDKIDEEYNKAV